MIMMHWRMDSSRLHRLLHRDPVPQLRAPLASALERHIVRQISLALRW